MVVYVMFANLALSLRLQHLLCSLQMTVCVCVCILITVAVMVNLICQLHLATTPRHLVKHYSRCFCEGNFWIRLTFKYMDSE